eukprot:15136273-Heterocapsa_arctica.AAC.1
MNFGGLSLKTVHGLFMKMSGMLRGVSWDSRGLSSAVVGLSGPQPPDLRDPGEDAREVIFIGGRRPAT